MSLRVRTAASPSPSPAPVAQLRTAVPPTATATKGYATEDRFEASAAGNADQLAKLQSFVDELAHRMQLATTPRVRLNDRITGDAWYDEATGDVHLHPRFLARDGDHARSLLTHELVHDWQHERGYFRFNFPDTGLYVDAPTGPLWQALLNPFKLVRLLLYGLQPIEVHAELTRVVRSALGLLPASPW